jgi:hypothetical protein
MNESRRRGCCTDFYLQRHFFDPPPGVPLLADSSRANHPTSSSPQALIEPNSPDSSSQQLPLHRIELRCELISVDRGRSFVDPRSR